jgi:hypothetical protein
MRPETEGARCGPRVSAVEQTDDGRPGLESGDLTMSTTMTHDAATMDLNER